MTADFADDDPIVPASIAPSPPPLTASYSSGQTLTVSVDGQTIVAQEPGDVIIDSIYSDNDIFSYQGGVSDAEITIGTGTHNIVELNIGDTLTAGNGNNTVYFTSGATNDTISLGNGNNLVNDGYGAGNFTVWVGTGSDYLEFFNLSSGSVTVSQALGAQPDVVDFSTATLSSGTVTVTNAGDDILTDSATITNLTINVAVDGYKPPYDATTVNYVATSEAIAAPYNQAQPLPYFVANLLFNPVPHWNATIGGSGGTTVLTFSFMQSVPSYASATDANGFAPLGPNLPAGYSPAQLLAMNQAGELTLSAAEISALGAFEGWESVANMEFVSASDSNSVQIRLGSNSQGTDEAGYAYDPLVPAAPYYSGSSYLGSGNVYLNTLYDGDAGYFSTGGYGNEVFMHEIGHAIGMGGESGASDPHDVLPYGEDSIANTVMSYNVGDGPWNEEPKDFDIATIQYLYGANPDYHPNPTHVWTFSASGGSTNLISDGGGDTNTISAAGTTAAAYIDLRQGHWSYLGAQSDDVLAPDQLFIDYGTVIEDAVAGSGSDTIVCNDGSDAIACGSGDDLVVVAGGTATIAGGSGLATAEFAGTLAQYAVSRAGGNDGTVVGDGQDAALTGVHWLQFSNVTVALDDAAAATDFYDSGTSDIVWENNGTGQVALWRMSGGAPSAYDTFATAPANWQIVASADFYGGGDSALLWENLTTDQAAIWEMSGATPIAYTTIANFPAGWQVAGVGDFYGGADADILWRNPTTTQIALWQMNGASPVSETIIGAASAAWKVAGVADFNGDGYADILWQNSSTSQVAIWEMNGASVAAYTVIGTVPANWTIAGIGDFSGNGTQSILFENQTTDQLAVWQTNGASLTAAAIVASGVPFGSGWQIAAIGDYNGDGRDDILWQNQNTGQIAIWQLNGLGAPSYGAVTSGIPTGWHPVQQPTLAA